jgi:hypothetical protein
LPNVASRRRDRDGTARANIPVFLPDEYAMQALSVNISAYGFVRVQVPPSEYQNAREILEA